MNKILLTVLFLSFFTLISCDNNDIVADDEFRVIIGVEKDISCGLPVITFLDNLEKVKEKTSLEILTYTANQLDTSLNTKEAELIIKFSVSVDPKVCNTLGIRYSSIIVLKARLAN